MERSIIYTILILGAVYLLLDEYVYRPNQKRHLTALAKMILGKDDMI